MPMYCCVPGCKSRTGGHKFPKDLTVNYKWRVAIRRADQYTKELWKPKAHDRVCSKHFTETDYRETLLGEKKRLKSGAVPTVFDFVSSTCTPSSCDVRMSRRRHQLLMDQPDLDQTSTVPNAAAEIKVECSSSFSSVADNPPLPTQTTQELGTHMSRRQLVMDQPDSDRTSTVPDAAAKIKVEYSSSFLSVADNPPLPTQTTQELGTQCQLLYPANTRESIKLYENDRKAVCYLTGFHSFSHFQLFFNALGPAVDHLNFKCNTITPEDQCFLTLIKLRQAFDDEYLAIRFKLSESTVSHIVNTWINFMYFQLKEMDAWPERELIDQHLPDNFKEQFPKKRVILVVGLSKEFKILKGDVPQQKIAAVGGRIVTVCFLISNFRRSIVGKNAKVSVFKV